MKSLIILLFLAPLFAYAKCPTIGVLTNFNQISGDGNFNGNQTYLGAKKAVKELKTIGRCYKLKKYHTGSNLLDIKKAIEKATKDNVKYFVGLRTTNRLLYANKILNKQIVVSPTATSNIFINNPKVFLTSGTNHIIARKIIKDLNKNLTKRKIAFIFDTSNFYANELQKHIKEQLKSHINVMSYDYASSESAISNIAEINAHSALIIAEEKTSTTIMEHINRGGKIKHVLGADTWGPYVKYIRKRIRSFKNIQSIINYTIYKLDSKTKQDTVYFSYLSTYILDKIIRKKRNTTSLHNTIFEKTGEKIIHNYLNKRIHKRVYK